MRILTTLSIAIFVSALLLTACEKSEPSESVAETAKDTPVEHAKKHLDVKYVCPMHPEIVSNEPGSCSICGMFLVEQEVKPEPPVSE